jgi:AbiV family abortive infection protein
MSKEIGNLLELGMKTLENAIELIEDANILLEEDRFSRVYSLSHLACEELAKVSMAFGATVQISAGITIDTDRLMKKIQNHKDKIKGIAFLNYLQHGDKQLFYKDIDNININRINQLKNESLYAGLSNDTTYAPADKISAELAKNQLNLAKELLHQQVKMASVVLPNLLRIPQKQKLVEDILLITNKNDVKPKKGS